MLKGRRAAASSTRQLLRPSPRRFESHGAAHDHGHSVHHHTGPVNESFGRGFYITLAAIPTAFALYKFSYSDPTAKPWAARVLEKYSDIQSEWDRRNTLHTTMIERAAADRNLFQSEPVNQHFQLRFPEAFNTGSPLNVPPGRGGADLDHLVAFYERKNRETAEKTEKRVLERESK